MFSFFRPSLITASILCAVPLFGPAAAAHAASPPSNMAELIKRSAESGRRRRVPLLAVGAEQMRPSWRDDSHIRLQQLYLKEDADPPLSDALAAFKHQVISCSSVQIVAPINRVTLNPYPGPPEEWARIGRERAARLLFASLSPAQWATASSAGGLGLSDLRKQEQKSWFLSLIPEPFVLQEMEAVQGGGATTVRGADGELHITPVSPEQVRIRVVRKMNWWYKRGTQGSYISYGYGDHEGRTPGQRFWDVVATEGQRTAESYRDRLRDAVVIVKPNRLQKGDLSFNGAPLFGKTVSLAGAKTLGDLVQRVAEATGMELYADRRLTGLTVTAYGAEDATADAADVMKALCLATTGCIRKVTDSRSNESVYLLAGDHAPLMPGRIRLAEWASDVDALLNAEQTTFHKAAMAGGVARGIGFAENAAGQINDAVMREAEERITDPKRYENFGGSYIPVPVSALPAAGQAKVRRDLEGSREYSTDEVAIDDKNVYAQFSVETLLLVPGFGAHKGPNLTSLESLLPRKAATPPPMRSVPTSGPILLPPALRQFAVLKIAPKNNDEAEAAVRWAAGHGFSALFVRASLWEDGEAERIARIAAIGTKHGVKIYPAASLLRVPPAEPAKKEAAPHHLARARNIFGETLRQYAYRRQNAPAVAAAKYVADQIAPLREADWLDVSDETVRKTVAGRLALLARAPGIAGMVCGDAAAPGSALPQYSWSSGATAARHAGFNDTLRLVFIRQENADPLDMPPYGDLGPYIDWNSGETSPFVGDSYQMRDRFRQNPAYRKDVDGVWKAEKTPAGSAYDLASSSWNALVREKNRSWIGEIRKAADLPPSLPVYLEATAETTGGIYSPWTTPWADSEPLMPKEMGTAPLLSMPVRRESTAVSVRRGLSLRFAQLEKQKKSPFSGIVIDLTAKPVDEGLSLLSPLAPAMK